MPLKDRYLARSSRKGLPRTVAQAAAKKSWENRNLPNWRDRVDDLLKGNQILVKDLRQFNSIYVAAKRKRVHTLRFKVSDSKFAVVAEGIYDRKIEFILAGNVYYTRTKVGSVFRSSPHQTADEIRAFFELRLPAVVIHNAIVQSERAWDEDEQSAVIFAIVWGSVHETDPCLWLARSSRQIRLVRRADCPLSAIKS